METRDLLLEIGTEEIPSGYFEDILDLLMCREGGAVRQLFDAQNITVDSVRCYSTPRRILMHIEDIPVRQSMSVEGPPVRVAFDKENNPTRALESFLKKNNASIDEIERYHGDKEERVRLPKRDVSNKEILEAILPKVIAAITFPKSMRWDSSGITFARPIRWILALFGSEPLRFFIGNVNSSNFTSGHRFLGHKKITVKDTAAYFKVLEKNSVVLDNKARKEQILSYLQKASWHCNNELLDEVNNLVESPFFIKGTFGKEYLSLPDEILLASMAKHQRVFCLEDRKGRLTNTFIAIINGRYRGRRNIRSHHENVLDARLKDALFFYNTDTKIPLAKWAEGLDGVIFHKQLGTVKDKVARLKQIGQFLAKNAGISPEEKKSLMRAISLCKADLLTSMVREFPSLQGVVGKYYALASGEERDTAEIIGEHYLPRFAEDDVPSTPAAAVCSLADKFDNIVCYFKIGKAPKAGWDLYALRRQSIGIISVLLKQKISIRLSDVIDYAYEFAPCENDKEKICGDILDFFKERFTGFVKERFSYRYDLLDAVTASGVDDPYNSFLKLENLNSIIDKIYFEDARRIVERTHNIIKSSRQRALDIRPSLFKEPQERALYESYTGIKGRVTALCSERKYLEATRLYADSLSDKLHEFFDKVMVNVDSKDLKANRIGLLSAINRLYVDSIADLSRVVVSRGDKAKKEEEG